MPNPGCDRNDCSSSWWRASGHLAASSRARPDAFRPDLGLNDLSLPLAALGLAGGRGPAVGEATGTYRELAAARPDAFRPGQVQNGDRVIIWFWGSSGAPWP